MLQTAQNLHSVGFSRDILFFYFVTILHIKYIYELTVIGCEEAVPS